MSCYINGMKTLDVTDPIPQHDPMSGELCHQFWESLPLFLVIKGPLSTTNTEAFVSQGAMRKHRGKKFKWEEEEISHHY